MDSVSYQERLSKNCYYVCLGLWAVGLVFYGVLLLFGISLTQLGFSKCILLSVLGLYCPGCGGTRAVESFLQGDLLQSIIYHPLVPYTAIFTLVYMSSHTLHILTKGRIKAMQFRVIYLFIMLGILIAQWIGKNVLKLAFFIELC